MSVIEDIGDIITWYQKQYAGAPIEQYMDAKSKLVGLLFKHAGELADAKLVADGAEITRRTDYARFKVGLIEDGCTIGLAESRAELAIKVQRKHEGECAAIFFKQRQLHEMAVKAVEDMAQRISILRRERENA